MKESEEELVKLPGGFIVRRRFTRSALVHLANHSPVLVTMAMVVDDSGRADVLDTRISCRPAPAVLTPTGVPGEDPLGDDELCELSLIDVRDGILQLEAQEMTPDRGFTRAEVEASTSAADFDAVVDRDAQAALRSVKSARRRRQVTPELLARVLELYEQSDRDIKAVMTATNYSESYCFKLLRKAREETKKP